MLGIMQDRCHEASIDLEVQPNGDQSTIELGTEVAYACHRILLEALTNTIRHSGAGKVNVTLRKADKQWQFTVRDDGNGFDAQTPAGIGHYGLQGMKERAGNIDAELDISSSKDGTAVTLTLPLE